MATNINAYLEFMKGKEQELNAMVLTADYEKQLAIAEKEKNSCVLLAS